MAKSFGIKGFTKVQGTAFDHINEKLGLRYSFDNTKHYEPHVLLRLDGRPVGYYETFEQVKMKVASMR